MERERESIWDLEARLASMNAELYQNGGSMPVTALESLCRRINLIRLKICSFKGDSRYGNKKK